VAVFDKSVKYQLIDAYGLDSFEETDEGLWFEFGYTNRGYLIGWLLGLGGKVKVLEPQDIVDELKEEARKIFENYQ